MDLKIILIYCVISDYLARSDYPELKYSQMSQSEFVTLVIGAALLFHGNHEITRQFLSDHGYIPNILSKSQLNRRIHLFDDSFWRCLLNLISKSLQHYESTHEYLIDSFPVSACDTSRIVRAKIFQGKEYHGYSPTKQRYFYGIKVHMLSSKEGVPVEVLITPGSEHDMKAFKRFTLDIPRGAWIYADRAYNDYSFEDFLHETSEITLIA